MPRIPDEIIQEIKKRADIVDAISEYVSLKAAGNAFKGLCPFHDDKGSSLVVNRDMQTFKCFACGEGGNVFAFLVKHKGMKFHEAVESLAEKYGIAIPKPSESKPRTPSQPTVQGEPMMRVSVEGQKTVIQSNTFTARFDGAALSSLRARDGDVEFLHSEPPGVPVDVLFMNMSTLGKDKHEECTITQLSDVAVRIVVVGEDSDRSLLIALDRDTGDLCVVPSSKTSRRGVVSVRWNLSFHPDADVILPCVNGILVKSGSEFPGNDRFAWPYRWNAQLAIAQQNNSSCMIRSQDTRFKFKALALGRDGDKTTLGT